MQETICAKVNPRLLSKADRLFTGNVEGRIIEILQNARRAGATEVRISNKDGLVTVQDNGSGIEDFQKLLDLGGSGWDERLEAGEDPAGVGLFSLAPRKVTIISGGRKIVIDKDGWTGKPVEVTVKTETSRGTILTFKDEKPWDMDTVEKHAVFAGIRVIVDGKYCHEMPFCSHEAVYYKNPGCRIEVVKDISKYHRDWTSTWYHGRVLLNFHGQVVQVDHWPSDNRQCLTILVDITDQTDIRLMLPARTRLVENQAFEQLKAVIELEYYKYFQRQKTHTLYYEEYLRARQLGIELPEAEPQFRAGLIFDEYEQAVEVVKPNGLELKDCYLCFDDDCGNDLAEVNAHLLSAIGKFEGKSFVPVNINKDYTGYSWVKLPKVTKVEVKTGKELFSQSILAGDITCFDKLSIVVHTSDGEVFASDVCMAIIGAPKRGKYQWSDNVVCVTKEARDTLGSDNIWYHLGGFNIEGDCYETQQYDFEKDLDEFWNELVGPYETLRQEIYSVLGRQYSLCDKWRKITFTSEGVLQINFKDGKTEIVNQPKAS
jgi:hypothetical protein